MSHKKLFFIAGGIAVLIVGVFYFEGKNPAPAPTEQWQTYDNQKHAFEFKYPDNFKITYDETEEGFKVQNDTGQITLTIANQSFEEAKAFANEPGGIFTVTEPLSLFELSGRSALKVRLTTGTCDDYIVYVSLDDTKTLHIAFGSCSTQQKNALVRNFHLIDQILSTFKFTDNPDTSDWKTYRNEEYGFEIRYPQSYTQSVSYFDQYLEGDPEVLEPPVKSLDLQLTEREEHFDLGSVGYGASVRVYENEHGLSPLDWFKKNTHGFSDEEMHEFIKGARSVNVDGAQAWQIFVSSSGGPVVVSKGSRVYQIGRSGLTDEIFNQILSTFKFIPSASSGQVSSTGTLSGKVSIGPICPVEQIDNPCPTPPEAYASREFLVNKDGKTVASFYADSNGDYSISLVAGTYIIIPAKTGIGYASKDLPANVTIKSGSTVTLNIDVDTGIR